MPSTDSWSGRLRPDLSGPPREVLASPHLVPVPLVVEWRRGGAGYAVFLTLVDGADPLTWAVWEVRVRADDDADTKSEAITGTVLRSLTIASFVDWTMARIQSPRGVDTRWFEAGPPGEAEAAPFFQKGEDGSLVAEPGRVEAMRRLGPSHPDTAAAIAVAYRALERDGIAPVKGLTDVLGLPSSTVSHWVKIAREVGALAPSGRKPRADRGRGRGDD